MSLGFIGMETWRKEVKHGGMNTQQPCKQRKHGCITTVQEPRCDVRLLILILGQVINWFSHRQGKKEDFLDL